MSDKLTEGQAALLAMSVQAELDANDVRIIRAIIDGDTARIEAHKLAQEKLRGQLK